VVQEILTLTQILKQDLRNVDEDHSSKETEGIEEEK